MAEEEGICESYVKMEMTAEARHIRSCVLGLIASFLSGGQWGAIEGV